MLLGHLIITTSKIQEVTEWGRQRGEEKPQCMCWRALRQSGNSSPYLFELKQHKDHFLYCWKHLDICTNLINARMWLLFVLSQIFLRRRCCSCNTDVSITPCWVQEFAYYQELPCLAMLREHVCSGTRIRTFSVTWCHLNTSSRKMGTLDQHRHRLQQSRAPAGGDWMMRFYPTVTTKMQTEATPLLPNPKKFRFWTSTSANTQFRFPNSHSLPLPSPASQSVSIALESRFKLVHTARSWCLWCSVKHKPLSDTRHGKSPFSRDPERQWSRKKDYWTKSTRFAPVRWFIHSGTHCLIGLKEM